MPSLLCIPIGIGHLRFEKTVGLHPDLMRSSVIDAEGAGSSANIHAERLPGEGLLKNPLAQIPGKEEGVRPMRAESSEESQVSDADILRLVYNHEVERRILARLQDRGQSPKH